MTGAPRFRRPDGLPVRRVAVLSVHTSPLEQPGTGDGGGLNVYVLQVGRRLAARGVEVDVFTRRTAPGQPEVVEVSPGLRVRRVNAGPSAHLPKEELTNHLCTFALTMLAQDLPRYDLIHAHYWMSGWVARRVAERWEVPFVQTFHTLAALKNATLAPGDVPESPLRLAAERRIARAADRVVGLTCGEARLLHRTFGLSGADIAVVPAGVDLDVFRPAPGHASHVAVRWRGGTWDGPVLLFVGRLQPLKGPDVAVRILAEVRATLPGARLVVVGGTSGSGEGRAGPAEFGSWRTNWGWPTPWSSCRRGPSRSWRTCTGRPTWWSCRPAARRSAWSPWRHRPAACRWSPPTCRGCATSSVPVACGWRATTRPTMRPPCWTC
jgi:D-inositol-3-phosphate glycosyltransferase